MVKRGVAFNLVSIFGYFDVVRVDWGRLVGYFWRDVLGFWRCGGAEEACAA